jgi:thiol-disulfide isomerase/thioredoxin
MKRKFLLSISLLNCFSLQGTQDTKHAPQPIKLCPSVIQYLDTPYAINGPIFELLLYVRQKLNSMLGIAQKDKIIQCHLVYKGQESTIKSLAEIETTKGGTQELEISLKFAKNLLEETLSPFIDQARQQKRVMTTLIEEWCQKCDRMDSLMLQWATAKDGEETAVFHSNITTFAGLETFCHDLSGFLSALINSCPKAQQEYKLKRKKQILAIIIDEIVQTMGQTYQIDAKKYEIITSELNHRLETDNTLISATPKPEEKAHIKTLIINHLTAQN